MFAAFCGSFLSTRIARPRIWFELMKLPTKLARISVFTQGESQPSPRSALVPMRTWIRPRSKAAVSSATLSPLPPAQTSVLYQLSPRGLTAQRIPRASASESSSPTIVFGTMTSVPVSSARRVS